ncbi:hypothetical protein ACCO45_001091 [Purpureocillium lilacinum]|uniref:Uncharacterized protein n=1 Tax=Purpureocillium lilacinum TaxID=33203 RepID=A0ACC4E639_PURLI
MLAEDCWTTGRKYWKQGGRDEKRTRELVVFVHVVDGAPVPTPKGRGGRRNPRRRWHLPLSSAARPPWRSQHVQFLQYNSKRPARYWFYYPGSTVLVTVGNTVPSPPAAFTLIWNHGSQPPKRQGPGHPSHRIHGHSRPRAYEPGTEHGYTVLHSISSNCYSTTTATTTIHAMQQGAEPGARATHDMIAPRPPDPPILPLASVWCAPDATLDRRAPPFPLQVLPRVPALAPPPQWRCAPANPHQLPLSH